MDRTNLSVSPPPMALAEDVLLAPYTSWKIGGPARWFAEPTLEQVPALLRWAYHQNIPIYFLGRGSNVLIDDAGLPGLVISTRHSMTGLKREQDFISADSGVFLPQLSQFAAKEGFSGFEFLIGIPGTVGGALTMNAGLSAFRPREMASVVEDFEVISFDGSVETLTMEDIQVGYRHTSLLGSSRLISTARFRLKDAGDPENIRRSTLEHLAERRRKQPLDQPTAGSTFKSPSGCKSAGWYIEQAGLKGTQVGAARVSDVHANWIENLGGATAADVRQLIAHVQSTVEAHADIHLEPEVVFVG